MLTLRWLLQALLGSALSILIWILMSGTTRTAADPNSTLLRFPDSSPFQDWILATPQPTPSRPIHKIELRTLPLFPDMKLAQQLDSDFEASVASLNERISQKQSQLHRMLQDWSTSENVIRLIQKELSQLRTERDRLALEHLLIRRQLERNYIIPLPDLAMPQVVETP